MVAYYVRQSCHYKQILGVQILLPQIDKLQNDSLLTILIMVNKKGILKSYPTKCLNFSDKLSFVLQNVIFCPFIMDAGNKVVY